MLVVGLLLIAAPQAMAGFMGNTLSWQYYAYGGPYSYTGGTTNGSFVADGGIGGTFIGGTGPFYFDIIANDTQLIFDYSIADPTGAWTNSAISLNSDGLLIRNGILITSTDLAIPDNTSLSINPLTNMAGFTLANITYNARNIAIDWMGLAFNQSTRVVLDVHPQSVPEPTTLLLLGSGLAGLGFVRRKFKN